MRCGGLPSSVYWAEEGQVHALQPCFQCCASHGRHAAGRRQAYARQTQPRPRFSWPLCRTSNRNPRAQVVCSRSGSKVARICAHAAVPPCDSLLMFRACCGEVWGALSGGGLTQVYLWLSSRGRVELGIVYSKSFRELCHESKSGQARLSRQHMEHEISNSRKTNTKEAIGRR